jgi:hypothetical protein
VFESSQPDPRAGRRRITRRNFLIAGGAAGLGIAAYAGTHARHELEVVQVPLAIRNLPDAFVGFCIVQLSDLHLHEFTEPWFAELVVERVNSLQPDLVLFTGDLISDGPHEWPFSWKAAGEAAEILSRLRAPQRFAIPGNHDDVVGVRHIVEPLEAHGTPVLLDRHVPIERGGDRFWLCGTQDALYNRPDFSKTIPVDPKEPVFLMIHEPDIAHLLAPHRYGKLIDVMFSGHSHGGQVRLPWIGPLQLPELGRMYVQGLYQVGSMQLYVNRGIGTTGLPFRLNCKPEITEFTLARA